MNLNIFNLKKNQYLTQQAWRLQHPFHLPNSSPWPILLSVSILCFALCLICYMHYDSFNIGFRLFFLVNFIFLIQILLNWFFDIFDESYRYNHNTRVLQGLQYGMILFIISEIFFFLCFFSSFIYYSISPNIFIGCIWPPLGIKMGSIYGIPFLNTYFLLSSGLTLYYAELNVIKKFRVIKYIKLDKKLTYDLNKIWYNKDGELNRMEAIEGFSMTLLYGFIFILLQYYEYNVATFDITDSVYGSIFYLMTGFHGFHVIIGLIFIYVCVENHGRFFYDSLYSNLSFKCGIWYWHFVGATVKLFKYKNI